MIDQLTTTMVGANSPTVGAKDFSPVRANDYSPLLTILGWLWKDPLCITQYSVEHANIWARMIRRHLTIPHRFVLLTDQPDCQIKRGPCCGECDLCERCEVELCLHTEEPFDSLITPVKLWDDHRELKSPLVPRKRPQCYVKLKAFSSEAAEIIGPRFASIDLDCVVTGNMDHLFNRSDEFVIWRRAPFGADTPSLLRGSFQSSMWLLRAGARREVWEDFHGLESLDALRTDPRAEEYLHTEQGWLLYKLENNNEAMWGMEDGVYDFRWLLKQSTAAGMDKPALPENAAVVFFPGKVKPWDRLDVPWIAEHWQ